MVQAGTARLLLSVLRTRERALNGSFFVIMCSYTT
nr:hypothetical protein RWETBTHO_RWETBTHO_CDS_0004 [Microvirus sp.]